MPGASTRGSTGCAELRKVLPESTYPIIDVPLNHSILHTLFDAKRIPQIPAIGNAGRTDAPTSDGTTPQTTSRT